MLRELSKYQTSSDEHAEQSRYTRQSKNVCVCERDCQMPLKKERERERANGHKLVMLVAVAVAVSKFLAWL